MVPSNPGLLRTAVSVPQPSSGSRPEPRLTDCRLATRVRSRERTRLRRAHSFGCHKHEIRSASRWASCISDPRLCGDCGQSWSTWLGDPWATGADRAWASCRSSGQAGNSNQHLEHTLLREITGSNHQFSRIGVSQQPLASGSDPVSLAQHQQQIAGKKTVFERVRDMPDQTLAQAMEKAHHSIRDSGPMLLTPTSKPSRKR